MDQRPKLHFTSQKNWLNDPNGFSYYKGHYHLFYQYNPYGVTWGNMTWAHAISKDLIHWEHLPHALLPDQPYDKDGVFSGTVFIEEDIMHIYYTGIANPDEPEPRTWISTQCHAWSEDGEHFIKDEANPIVHPDPRWSVRNDFRDPKVYKEDGMYHMLVAAGLNGSGRLLLFESRDRKDWTIEAVLEKEGYGYMWECPDLLWLEDGNHVILSAMGVGQKGYENEVFIGPAHIDSDGKKASVADIATRQTEIGNLQWLDYGKTLYAPQTMAHKKNPTVMMGWLMMKEPFEGEAWTGMMTIPREIRRVDGHYIYNMVPSVYEAFDEPVNVDIKVNEEVSMPPVCLMDMTMSSDEKWQLHLMEDGMGHGLAISYDIESRHILVDRHYTQVGQKALEPLNDTMAVPTTGGEQVELEILVDQSAIEIFVDGGRYVLSTLVPVMTDQPKLIWVSGDPDKCYIEIRKLI